MPAKLLLVGCGLTSALTASLLSKTTSLELTIWEKARGVGQSANSGGFGFLRVQSFFLFFWLVMVRWHLAWLSHEAMCRRRGSGSVAEPAPEP